MASFSPSRIAIVSGGYLLNASGSEKGAQALAEALAKRSKEVHVITFYAKGHPEKYNGVQIHPVLNKFMPKNMRFIHEYVNSIHTIYKLVFICKKLNIQVLNVHDNQMLAVYVGLVGKILKIPVILCWIRTSDIGFRGVGDKPSVEHKIRKLKAGLAIKLADLVLTKGPCPSEFHKFYKTDINKFIHTPNPIQLPKNRRASQSLSATGSLKSENGFIVSTLASRLDETKNIDTILKTAVILKSNKKEDIKFMIIGGREPSRVDFWRQKAKEYDIQDHIIFTGFKDDVYPFLINSSVYIFPSQTEVCCSRGLLEAMSLELPTICRRTKSMAHWFNHLKNIYLVNEATPEEFAKAILYLKGRDSVRKEIGKNARQIILKDWDVEKFADKFLDICLSIISSYA